MPNAVSLAEVKKLAQKLSIQDKLRLVEWIAPQIKRDLQTAPTAPRRQLRGLWRGLDLTEQDIDQGRRESWTDFPRDNI